MDLSSRKSLLSEAILASIIAGKEILEIYESDDFGVQLKSDNSPLTIADQRAHNAIVKIIEPLGIPVLSEEGEHLDYTERKKWEHCWIVDPLDGTKEFVKRNDEFTVNIALIERGVPVAGVIYVPVYRQLYFADIELGAYRVDDIVDWDKDLNVLIKHSAQLPLEEKRDNTIIVGSRSHMNDATSQYIDDLLSQTANVEMITKGSSLKLCMIAENKADIYPRFAPTMEWDIAAGHAIVSASGAKVLQFNSNQELIYNKEDLLNPWFICKR